MTTRGVKWAQEQAEQASIQKWEKSIINKNNLPGMVAHVCNPNTWGGWGGQITWDRDFETRLRNMAKPCLYKKTLKISYEW